MVAAQVIALVILTQATPRDAQPPVAGATLAGRVTERGSDRPLPRIVVSLEAPAAQRFEALTDAEGRYTFADVLPGGYVLAASPDGTAPHL